MLPRIGKGLTMEREDFEEYLQDRYLTQIAWYDRRAGTNKIFYTIFQWFVIVISSIIPVLVVTLKGDLKWVTAVLGIFLAIGTSGLKSFKFQENWINYRTIAETLKKEKYFYIAGLEGYGDSSDREALFVERVESLISRENSLWISSHKPKEIIDEKGRGTSGQKSKTN
jgi:hypothetical protein